MAIYTLYGDGIHDDAPAIQEFLDSGIAEVFLPAPRVHYCIGTTLRIHSCQTLRLAETAKIRLLPNSNCLMLENAEKEAHDIAVVGGIWDYNNKAQRENPFKTGELMKYGKSHFDANPDTVVEYTDGYFGAAMRFYKVTRLSIHDLTVKDPVTYCIKMAYVQYFNVENIKFDQNLGNPTAENMDGIHIDGGCRFGSITNVQGTCYDDIVALNADDGCDGPIEDIKIDGVFGRDSLRGVRLLSIKSPVARISIQNVYGTFYQNCIGLTYFYPRNGLRGKMSHISIRNVYGKNAPRRPEYNKGDNSFFGFSFVWIDGDIDIDLLSIDMLCRNEELSGVETLKVCKNAHIRTLSLSNVIHQNSTDRPITCFLNEGEIERLYMYNVDASGDLLLDNRGSIGKITEL